MKHNKPQIKKFLFAWGFSVYWALFAHNLLTLGSYPPFLSIPTAIIVGCCIGYLLY